MLIECSTCPGRGLRCDGCVMNALEALPPPTLEALPTPTLGPLMADTSPAPALDAAQRRAVQLFVDAGLVRPEHARTLRARVEPSQWRASG